MSVPNPAENPQAGQITTPDPSDPTGATPLEPVTPEPTDPVDTPDPEADPVDKPELSPEDLKSALETTRREAASWRTKLREAEDRLKNAKTVEEFEELGQSLRHERETVEHDLLRELVAAKAGLPDSLAKRLTGATREELEADAEELKAFAPKKKPTGNPTGGLDPTEADSTSDMTPEQAVEFVRKNRY